MNQPTGPRSPASLARPAPAAQVRAGASESTHSVRLPPTTAAGRNLRAALADAERAMPPAPATQAAAHASPARAAATLVLRTALLDRGRRWWAEVLLLAALAAACLAVVGIVAKAAAASRGPDTTSIVVRIPAAPPVSRGVPLVTLPWGEGPGQVGISRPGEGIARAPEALAVALDGRIAVLDSVNRRVVTLTPDGQVQTTFTLPLRTPRFLAVDDQSIHVLDADDDHQLLTFDWDGAALSSRGFDPGQGTVTGLFSRSGCAYVETEHARVVSAPATDLAGPAGVAFLASVDKPGRPIAGPSPVFAQARFARGERPHVRVSDAAEGAQGAVDVEFAPETELDHLVSLDGDRAGDVILGARLTRPQPTEDGVAALMLARASTDGAGPVDALRLCDDKGIAETGQPYVVAPDGRIYQPKATPAGYVILVHTFPKAAAR